MKLEYKMKIHILRENQQQIENFKRITIQDNKVDLSEISDNECSFILANDALDSFSIENISPFIQSLTKKIRIQGTLVIGGTDIRLFCKHVINGSINENEASKIIDNVKSMTTLNESIEFVRALGLNIESAQMNGTHYEIKAKRG